MNKIDDGVTIGVAGHAETHPDAISRVSDLAYLKEKVDAGANFIITNVCFSFENLSTFIKDCRSVGIKVPIIPGVYIPTTYDELMNMCRICSVNVPHDQLANYRLHRNDRERFAAYALENAELFLKRIFSYSNDDDEEQRTYGVHFYTLNKYEHIFEIVRKFNFQS